MAQTKDTKCVGTNPPVTRDKCVGTDQERVSENHPEFTEQVAEQLLKSVKDVVKYVDFRSQSTNEYAAKTIIEAASKLNEMLQIGPQFDRPKTVEDLVTPSQRQVGE